MTFLKNRKKNNPLQGRLVISCHGKVIGSVTDFDQDTFIVKKRLFGIWPAYGYMEFKMDNVDKIDSYEVRLLPSGDEYWRLPGDKYFIL